MTKTSQTMRVLILGTALVLGAVTGRAQVAHKKKLKKSPPVAAGAIVPNATQPEVQLKLTDGSLITVEDAWESEQGIWYKQSGVTHLIPPHRVKTIERRAKSTVDLPAVQIADKDVTKSPTLLQPVWLHLIGGARVEADSATESAAGVWYTRGALSIFIEHSRIDHIERESLEVLAGSESSGKERGWTTGRPQIDGLIRHNAAKFGLDPYLVFCVMEQESHFNSHAQSPKGARGLMQLMPGTAARFGVRKSFDPAQNIAGGTRYLQQLSQQFNGRVDLMLASYNAGEGAVMKYGRKVPPYRETRNYVKRISYRYRRGKPPVASAQGNISTARGT